MCWSVFDLPAAEREVARLEKASAAPEFWNNSTTAQTHMRRLAERRRFVETWRGLHQRLADAAAFQAMAAEEDAAAAADIVADIDLDVAGIDRELAALAFELTFAGPYDDRNAILAVYAGAGGTESQDWTEMLQRMYLRWAERRDLHATLVDQTWGDEAGIKNATIEIEGRYAYGWLRGERGVHRLVRISPFDSAHARHTSFALVEVMPEVADAAEVSIKPDDLRLDNFRASGHGGQNVQKNSTAIRITHIPSGIVVSCQNERSLLRNKDRAMCVLESRLLEIEVQKRETERARLKGDHVEPGWGNQIRSYVLQPYKMVKDLRTGYETGDPDRVLDGDLDALMGAYLQSRIGEESETAS